MNQREPLIVILMAAAGVAGIVATLAALGIAGAQVAGLAQVDAQEGARLAAYAGGIAGAAFAVLSFRVSP